MKATSAKTSPATTQRRTGAWRKYIPHAIGAALVILIVNGLRTRPVEVEVGVVSTGPLTVTVLEEGKTRIRHRYVVSPPVSGFLRRVELRAGAPIKKGETILAIIEAESASLLNPRALAETEARVKAAEATRDQREATMERARASLAASGLSNGAIASLRRVSERTIANQLASAFRKLGVGSRFELTCRWSRSEAPLMVRPAA